MTLLKLYKVIENQYPLASNDSPFTIIVKFTHYSPIETWIENTCDVPHNTYRILLQILNYIYMEDLTTFFIKFLNLYGNYGDSQCVKSVRIWSYSGPYFPAFELNTERYSLSLRIQSKCGKIQTWITPITDAFHAVSMFT